MKKLLLLCAITVLMFFVCGALFAQEEITAESESAQEWIYAARGANPGGAHWDYRWPGTDIYSPNELGKYLWAFSPEAFAQTGEVGSVLPLVLPNGRELYDMMGMVRQWVDWPSVQQQSVCSFGSDFFSYDSGELSGRTANAAHEAYAFDTAFVGLRLARNGN